VRPVNLLARTRIYQTKEHGGAQHETFEYYLGNKKRNNYCMHDTVACVRSWDTDQGAVNYRPDKSIRSQVLLDRPRLGWYTLVGKNQGKQCPQSRGSWFADESNTTTQRHHQFAPVFRPPGRRMTVAEPVTETSFTSPPAAPGRQHLCERTQKWMCTKQRCRFICCTSLSRRG
jgi:hypothetical protein